MSAGEPVADRPGAAHGDAGKEGVTQHGKLLGSSEGFRDWGLGFWVLGLGFWVWGLGFRVLGLGFRLPNARSF